MYKEKILNQLKGDYGQIDFNNSARIVRLDDLTINCKYQIYCRDCIYFFHIQNQDDLKFFLIPIFTFHKEAGVISSYEKSQLFMWRATQLR